MFFKLAFRSLLANRLNTIINVVGLSLGIAAFLFLFLYVRYEISFDKNYPNSDRIYRIVGIFDNNNSISTNGFTRFPVAPGFKGEIPGIDAYCRVSHNNFGNKVTLDNKVFEIDLQFADKNFFNFFNFSILSGNLETLLNKPNAIVLTEQTAERLFGTSDCIGKILRFNHDLFTVSGIAVNPPRNNHIQFDAIASLKYIEQNEAYFKSWRGGQTYSSYLLLEEAISPGQIESQIPDLAYRKINKYWEGIGWSQSFMLQNIEDIHISDGSINHDYWTNRNNRTLINEGMVCFIILLLASINYIILYTAQKNARIKNIEILKIQGAGKFSILRQTFVEVLLVSSISALVGIALLYLGVPFLNSLLDTFVQLNGNLLSILSFMVSLIVVLSLLITLLTTRKDLQIKRIGTSNFKPLIKSTNKHDSKLLVSIQFALVIILLISVFTITKQNKFLLDHDLGFNKKNILILESEDEFSETELYAFKQIMLNHASVQSVSLTSQIVGKSLTKNGYHLEGDLKSSMINVLYTDADFLECFNIDLLEGRNFSANAESDKDAILINQKLVKKTTWDTPLEMTIQREGTLKVIGVVKNFNFSSLKHNVQPLVIVSNPSRDGWGYSCVNLRFQTENIGEFIGIVEKEWKEFFPNIPFSITFLDETLKNNYNGSLAQQRILSFFSLVALFISIFGIFGLTVFNIGSKIKEIGIRKVNGAKATEIILLLNRDFIQWIIISYIVSMPIAYYIMFLWLQNFAYKTVLSWWIFVMSGLLVMAIAISVVSLKSWKSANKNPVKALRYE